MWIVAFIIVLVVVLLAAGFTALGYGPLASRFKSLRTSADSAATAPVGSLT